MSKLYSIDNQGVVTFLGPTDGDERRIHATAVSRAATALAQAGPVQGPLKAKRPKQPLKRRRRFGTPSA